LPGKGDENLQKGRRLDPQTGGKEGLPKQETEAYGDLTVRKKNQEGPSQRELNPQNSSEKGVRETGNREKKKM